MDRKVPEYYVSRLGVSKDINYDEALSLMKNDFLVVFMFTMKISKKSFYNTMKKYLTNSTSDKESSLKSRIKFCKSLSSMITHSLIELEGTNDDYYEDTLSMIDLRGLVRDLYMLVGSQGSNEINEKYRFLIDAVESNSSYLYETHVK